MSPEKSVPAEKMGSINSHEFKVCENCIRYTGNKTLCVNEFMENTGKFLFLTLWA